MKNNRLHLHLIMGFILCLIMFSITTVKAQSSVSSLFSGELTKIPVPVVNYAPGKYKYPINSPIVINTPLNIGQYSQPASCPIGFSLGVNGCVRPAVSIPFGVPLGTGWGMTLGSLETFCATYYSPGLPGYTLTGTSLGDYFSICTYSRPEMSVPSTCPAQFENINNRCYPTGTVYSVSPALPAGLFLNSSTGVIFGTPTIEVPETNYTITRSNSCNQSSSCQINITTFRNPTILIQPASAVTLCALMSPLKLSVTTTGTSLRFQWRFNGVPLEDAYGSVYGSTTRSLLITLPDSSVRGTYDVVIKGLNNDSIISTVSTVNIITPPGVSISASGPTTFCAGNSVSLNFQLTSQVSGLTYNWTPGNLTTPNIQAFNTGNYKVEITDGVGCKSFSNTMIVEAVNPNASIDKSTLKWFYSGQTAYFKITGANNSKYTEVRYSLNGQLDTAEMVNDELFIPIPNVTTDQVLQLNSVLVSDINNLSCQVSLSQRDTLKIRSINLFGNKNICLGSSPVTLKDSSTYAGIQSASPDSILYVLPTNYNRSIFYYRVPSATIWSSSDSSVARVSSNGLITSLKEGTTTISPTYKYETRDSFNIGRFYSFTLNSSAIFTVSKNPKITYSRSVLYPGQKLNLIAEGLPAALPNLWSSSNLGAATISYAGLLQTIAPGITTIHYNSLFCGNDSIRLNVIPLVINTSSICAKGTGSILSPQTCYDFTTLTPVYTETFDNGIGNWTITNESGSPSVSNWAVVTAPLSSTYYIAGSRNYSTQQGGKFMMANAAAGGYGIAINTTLTSPVYNLSGLCSPTLTFEQTYSFYAHEAVIQISSDGGSSWSDLSRPYYLYNNQPISLAAYEGQRVQIRFKYITQRTQGEFNRYWILDNIKISALPGMDNHFNAGGTNSYNIKSYSWMPGGKVTPTITVKPTLSTNYKLKLYFQNGDSTVSNELTVNPYPTASGKQNICLNEITTFTGSGIPASTNPWKSNDTTVATVSNSGQVRGKRTGTTTITYTNFYGCDTSLIIIVKPLPTLQGVVAGSNIICTETTKSINVIPYISTGYSWSISDLLVASITPVTTSLVITPIKVGGATIHYSDNFGCSVSAQITVSSAQISGDTTSLLCEGFTTLLMGAGTPASVNPWVSDNPTGVSVNDSGLVTGYKYYSYFDNDQHINRDLHGQVQSRITYTNNLGCSRSVVLTKRARPVINGLMSSCVGQQRNLYSDTSLPENVVSWTTSDSSIVGLVNHGIYATINSIKAGSSIITIRNIYGCEGYKKIEVAGRKPLQARYRNFYNAELNKLYDPIDICEGLTDQIYANDTSSVINVWASSNPSIASISPSGLVTANSMGSATISTQDVLGCINTAVINVHGRPILLDTIKSIKIGTADTLHATSHLCNWCPLGYPTLVDALQWNISSPLVNHNQYFDYGVGARAHRIYAVGVVDSFVTATFSVTNTLGCNDTRGILEIYSDNSIKGTKIICVGATSALTAWGQPALINAWSSLDTNIVKVSPNGTITGISAGNAEIVYVDSNGWLAKTTITVKPTPIITGPFFGTYGDNYKSILMSNYYVPNFSWSSSDLSVATTDYIQVKPVYSGSDVRTAVISGTDNVCTASFVFTVLPRSAFSGNLSLCIGDSSVLSTSNLPALNNPWTSSNLNVATVSNQGLVKGLAEGTTTISFTNEYGLVSNATVVVHYTPEFNSVPSLLCQDTRTELSINVPGNSLYYIHDGFFTSSSTDVLQIRYKDLYRPICAINGGGAEGIATVTFINYYGCSVSKTFTVVNTPVISGLQNICEGETTTLTGSGIPAVSGAWNSSNPGLASITNNGIITANSTASLQSLKIIYKNNFGCSSTPYNFNVNPKGRLSIHDSILCVGKVTTLSLLNWSYSISGNISNSNPLVASIYQRSNSQYEITALLPGTTTFTYTNSLGCQSEPVTLTVSPDGISTLFSSLSIFEGDSISLNTIQSSAVTWTSSFPNVASVSNTGLLKAISGGNKDASSIIEVTNNYGCTKQVNVKVIAVPRIPSQQLTICSGSTINLLAGMSGTSIPVGLTYTWTVSANSNITGQFDKLNLSMLNYQTLYNNSGIMQAVIYTVTPVSNYYGTFANASFTVTVNVKPNPSISGNISNGLLNICKDGSTILTGSGIPATSNAWSSSNPSLISVTNEGLVTSLGQGYAYINYLNNEGCSTNVRVSSRFNDVPISGPSAVCVNNNIQLLGFGHAESSDLSLATTTDYGTVTGISAGIVNIIFRQGSEYIGCYTTKDLIVNPLPSITGETTICGGTSMQLLGSGIPDSIHPWVTSYGSMILDVNHSGYVSPSTYGRYGSDFIRYTDANGCSATLNILVNPKDEIRGVLNICKGANSQLWAGLSTGAASYALSNAWVSSDTSVATIGDDGLVIGKSAGTTLITFTNLTGCTTSALFTVRPLPTINGNLIISCPGSSISLVGPSPSQWSYYIPPSSGNMNVSINSSLNDSMAIVTADYAGNFTVTVTDSFSCAVFANIIVEPQPDINGELISAALAQQTSVIGICTNTTSVFTSSAAPALINPWVSSDTTVAKINNEGLLSSISFGNTNISYTNVKGCTKLKTITVFPVSLVNNGNNIETCLSNYLQIIDLNNDYNGNQYYSSDPTVAEFIFGGTLSRLNAGTSTITKIDNNHCLSAPIVCTVLPNPTITGSLTICGFGLSSSLVGSGTPAAVHPWTSSDTTVAKVSDNGVVTSVSYGYTNITYTNINGCYTTVSLRVSYPLTLSGQIRSSNNWDYDLTDITDFNHIDFCSGGTGYVILVGSGGNSGSGSSWISSDTDVVSVNEAGYRDLAHAKGLSEGSSVITYTNSDGCSISATIYVRETVTSGRTNLCFGDSSILLAQGNPASLAFYKPNVGYQGWMSSNTNVANISSNGLVTTGNVMGSSIITYVNTMGCTARTNITVDNPIIFPSMNICEGNSDSLFTFGQRSFNHPFLSSDTSVVKVDDYGVVTAISHGTAIITYTALSGCTANSVITVGQKVQQFSGERSICQGENTIVVVSTTPASNNAWISSNTSSLVYNGGSNGSFYGLSAGTSTVTYTDMYGCKSTAVVTVKETPTFVSTGPLEICSNASSIFIGSGTPATINPYVSQNTTVATVNNSGEVSGVDVGVWSNSNSAVSRITYTNNLGCSVSKDITVYRPSTFSFILNPLCNTGRTTEAFLTSGNGLQGGTWSSLDPSIATAVENNNAYRYLHNNGLITAVSPGAARIQFTDTHGCSSQAVFNVTAPVISGELITCIGGVKILTASSDGYYYAWSSSNPSVATISNNGEVAGLSAGTTIITYQRGSCTNSVTFTVNNCDNLITGNFNLCRGSKHKLVLSGPNAQLSKWNWTSSNPSVATVSNTGIVTGLNSGTAVISCRNGSNGGPSVTISVNNISLSSSSQIMCSDQIDLKNLPNSTSWITGTPILNNAWMSSDNSIATVSSQGLVTKVQYGSVLITYNDSSGCSLSDSVKVNPRAYFPYNSGLFYNADSSIILCLGNTLALSGLTSTTPAYWSSNNDNIVSIANDGNIHANGYGSTKLYYTDINGCSSNQKFDIEQIDFASSDSVICELDKYLIVNLAGNPTQNNFGSYNGLWTSSNPSVISLSGFSFVNNLFFEGFESGTSTNFTSGVATPWSRDTSHNKRASSIFSIYGTSFSNSCSVCPDNILSMTSNVSLVGVINPTLKFSHVCSGIDRYVEYSTDNGSTWNLFPQSAYKGSSGYGRSGNGVSFDVNAYSDWSCKFSGCNFINGVPPDNLSQFEPSLWKDEVYDLSAYNTASTFKVRFRSTGHFDYSIDRGQYFWGIDDIYIGSNTSTTTNSNISVGKFAKALSAGTSTVSYNHGCKTVSKNIYVAPATFSGNLTTCVGSTTILVGGGTPSLSNPWSVANNDSSIAYISNEGLIHGVSQGTTNVLYKNNLGCTSKGIINVLAPIGIAGASTICLGTSFGMIGSGTSSSTNPWSSSNSNIATISNNGLVTGLAPGSINITYTNNIGCTANKSLQINMPSMSVETLANCGSYTWHGTTYTASNNTATWTGANIEGCDSIVTLNLTIKKNSSSIETISVCDSLLWHGNVYKSSNNTAIWIGTNTKGCDSVVTLHLTIKQPTSSIATISACNSFLWHGNVYNESNNTAIWRGTNASGCDSVVTLNLTIKKTTTSIETISVCDSLLWHGNLYKASNNTATWRGTNAVGCDSVVTLNLTIKNSTSSIETVSACDSYFWHGVNYTSSTNTATWKTVNHLGCDSIVTLHLTIKHSTTSTETISACFSYLWHGVNYTSSTNTATWIGTNVAVCDSIVTLHLTIKNTSSSIETISACSSYIWHGATYTSSNNTARWTGTDAVGCDSIVTLNLTIHSLPDISIDGTASICLGDSSLLTASGTGGDLIMHNLWFNGDTSAAVIVKAAGDYTFTGVTAFGCSTTVSKTVAVNICKPTATISGGTETWQYYGGYDESMPHDPAFGSYIHTDPTICVGSSVDLKITLTGNRPWHGELSDGTVFNTSTSPLILSVHPSTTTNYTIASLYDVTNLQADANDLTGSALVNVRPYSMAGQAIQADGPTTFCIGDQVILSVNELPSVILPVDQAPGVQLAVSLRKLRSGYTGPAIRLIRSSDNVEEDFGFLGNELDVSAINTWLNGSDGYCKYLYNQSSTNGDVIGMEQNDLGAQPLFVANGMNGRPILHFNAYQYMETPYTSNYLNQYSILYGAKITGASGSVLTAKNYSWIGDEFGGSYQDVYSNNSWSIGYRYGLKDWASFSSMGIASNNDYTIYASTHDLYDSYASLYKNGSVLLTGSSGALDGLHGLRLNGFVQYVWPFMDMSDFDFTELIAYPSSLSSDIINSLSNSNAVYYGGQQTQLPKNYTYLWSNGETTPSITTNISGNYAVTVTNENGCSIATDSTLVTVNSCGQIPGAELTGDTTICNGASAQLRITLTGFGPWQGTLSNGINFSGSTSPILINVSPSQMTTYSIASITANSVPITSSRVRGSAKVDVHYPTSSSTNYAACASAMPYYWNGIARSSAGTYTYTTSNSNGCDSVATLILTVSTVTPVAPTAVTQTLVSNVCGARVYRYTVTAVSNAIGYTWTLPTSVGGLSGVTIDSGDASRSRIIRLRYASNAAAKVGDSIKVKSWSGCGNSATKGFKLSNAALSVPLAPTALTITAVAPSNCGAKVYRYAAPVITTALATGTALLAPVTGYQWSFKGTLGNNAHIDSGDVNSQVILVSYASNNAATIGDSVRVAYTSLCGNSLNKAAKLTNVATTIPAMPASITITGISTTVCGNKVYRYAAPNLPVATATAAAATGYAWSFNGTLGDNAHIDSGDVNSQKIVVSYTLNSAAAAGDSVKLYYSSSCGNSATKALKLTNTLLTAPLAPASVTITLVSDICGARVYRYAAPVLSIATATAMAANGYEWSLPTGSAVALSASLDSGDLSGSNARYIRLKFTNNTAAIIGDSIRVSYTSGCGTSKAKAQKLSNVAATTLAASATLTGTTSICSIVGTSTVARYTASAVTGAVSYLWTLPSGAVIDSGSNGLKNKVRFITAGPYDSIYVQAVGANGCAGTKKVLKLVTTGCVTLPTSRVINPVITSTEESMDVMVYPNPTTSAYQLFVKSSKLSQTVKVRIVDIQGRVLKTLTFNSNETIAFGNELKAGVYLVEVREGDKVKTVRVMKY